MAEFPYMPLWTDAYLADTTHLTTIEHGAYLLLLMAAWRAGGYLPDDDRRLMRMAKVEYRQWRRLRPVMEEFWQIKDGQWSNARLLDELCESRQRRDTLSERGRANALKRWNRGHASRNATAMPENAIQTHTHNQESDSNESLYIDHSCSQASNPRALETNPRAITAEKARIEADFDDWWQIVPRKVGKGQARRAYHAARKKAAAEELTEGIRRYARSLNGTEVAFIAHPATWLNGERWLDEDGAQIPDSWKIEDLDFGGDEDGELH